MKSKEKKFHLLRAQRTAYLKFKCILTLVLEFNRKQQKQWNELAFMEFYSVNLKAFKQ